MQHVVIDGRIFRAVPIEASDSREAREHISAQRPIGHTTAKEIREAVSQ